MTLECHACGKRFRSMLAEARHRHNFPAMCRRGKRFNRFIEETRKNNSQPLLQGPSA